MRIKIKTLLIIILVLSFGLVFCLGAGQAQEKSWDFEEWRVDIEINKDSTFVVREVQTFNFQGNFHWVKRDIVKQKIRKITNVEIFDEEGRKLSGREVEISQDSRQVSIKLNFDLTDVQKTWVFQYKVHGGLGYFEEHDELYWNAVSAEREVPIKKVEVFIHLPEEVPQGLQQNLYIGKLGSKTTSSNYEVIESSILHYWGDSIGPYEDFTIVAGWPKGIIQPIETRWWFVFLRFLPFLIPSALIVFVFRKWQKSPRIKRTIIAQYEPPRRIVPSESRKPDYLPPAEVGALVDFKIQPRDLSAIIIDLAYRGYIKIIEKEERSIFGKKLKYSLARLKSRDEESNLRDYEEALLVVIFGHKTIVEIDELKNETTLKPYFKRINETIFKKLVSIGYFNRSPMGKARGFILTLAGVSFIGGFLIQASFSSIYLGFALMLVSIMLVLASRLLCIWLTLIGAEAKWYALGFKEYLRVAERFRLGACTPETFERYLSYAVAFKVEKNWASRFVNIYKEPPAWFESSRPVAAFTTLGFVNSISVVSDSVSSAVTGGGPSGVSGFGGGGFAGGGGGGGGSSAG